jgi:PAS domain S-box-containing protein
MVGSLPLVFWYVSLLSAAAGVLALTGYLVYARTDIHHRHVFVGFVAVQLAWTVTEIVKVLATAPTAKYALSLFANLLALTAIGTVGYFATVYTDRSTSPRKPQNACFLLWITAGVTGILTQPVLGLQYRSVEYVREPFAYLAVEPGPLYGLNVTVTVVVLLVSIAYLARLFASSSHRPTSSVLLLGVAAALSVVPNLVSSFNLVPLLTGYDYSVFGTVPFTVVLGYVVFFRGERDLAPIARTEIVDELDDALFGLDDAGRIIDVNAAARALLPGDIDAPIGRRLADVVPELAAEITLPSDPEGDVTATYTTVVDGSRTHYSVSVSPIEERETVAGYSLILRNVTAVESTRRELQRQNEQLESFATTVAHDLRNPLQVADGTTTLLRSELPETHPADRYLSKVDRAVSRMDAVLSELQTLAKHAQSVTETQTVAVGDTVARVTEQGDDLSVTVSPDGTIEAEPARLESILESLFRHSAAHGGSQISVGVTEDGFAYEDDGLRVPDTEQEDVFAYDTTSSTESAGLGLKIVRTEAKAQGWSVSLEPAAEGTRFVVSGADTSPEREVRQ